MNLDEGEWWGSGVGGVDSPEDEERILDVYGCLASAIAV